MCNTALHHFDPPEATRLLRELGRVAAVGVVVTDLVRSRRGLISVGLFAATVWRTHPITRHDGPASIRAAYTEDELRELAEEAGLGRVRITSSFFSNRMSLVSIAHAAFGAHALP